MDRINRDFDFASMSHDELEALGNLIDRELEGRAFEERLRREVESHLRRQQWVDSHSNQRKRGRS